MQELSFFFFFRFGKMLGIPESSEMEGTDLTGRRVGISSQLSIIVLLSPFFRSFSLDLSSLPLFSLSSLSSLSPRDCCCRRRMHLRAKCRSSRASKQQVGRQQLSCLSTQGKQPRAAGVRAFVFGRRLPLQISAVPQNT